METHKKKNKVRQDGERFPERNTNCIFDEQYQPTETVASSNNRTKKKIEVEQLSYLQFLENMERIDRAIRQAEDLDKMMMDVLDTILKIFDSDRAFLLYPCDPHSPTWHIFMERSKKEYPGVVGVEIPMHPEISEDFQELLDTSDPVVYHPQHGVPLPSEIAIEHSVKSLMSLAIYPKRGKPWVFGTVQCSYARVWTEDDRRLFKEIGRRVADGLSSLLLLRDLKVSEGKLSSTLASLDDLIFVLDKDGIVCDFFQPQGRTDYNEPFENILGKMFKETFPSYMRKSIDAAIKEVINSGNVQQFDYNIEIGGEIRWFSAKISERRDASASIAGVTIVARDITKRKQAEEELRESEERYRNIFENANDIIQCNKPDGSFLYVNRTWREKLGYSRQEAAGLSFFNIIHPDNQDYMIQLFQCNNPLDRPKNFETVFITRGGEEMIVESSVYFRFKEERLVEIWGVFRDTTESKQAEKALRASEERYRALYMDNPSMYFTVDMKEIVLSVNSYGAEHLGYHMEELIGQSILKIFFRDDRVEVRQYLNACRLKPGKIFRWESRKVRKDGSFLWVREAARAVKSSEGKLVILFVCEDITERKKAEEEIQKLSLSVEQSPALIIITDLKGNIEYVNRKFVEITGYSLEEVKGKNPNILKSGETSEEEYKRLWDTISSGREWRGEFHNKKKNGELYWGTAIISPIKNEKGKITHYLSVSEDITELKQLQQQLLQSQKMDSIGTLAGGIAHDFNNLLTAINGYASLSLRKIQKTNPAYHDILSILQAGEKAEDLTRQLLAFSRKQVYTPRKLDINHVISSLGKMIHRLIVEDIDIKMKLKPNIEAIKADPGQIEQILINLVVNARDAIYEQTEPNTEKRITIETDSVFLDEAFMSDHFDSSSGKNIIISVSDTGIGMDEELKGKIFEPFFTTKETGKGTGLGLSTVYGIVKQNLGNIYVYSESGKGTTFKIYWPASEKESIELANNQTERDVLSGHENILVVEDDERVRDFAIKSLHSFGYKVFAASNGVEALQLLQNKKLQIDLLLSDMVMPKMGGWELAEILREKYPEIRIVLTSGYVDNRIFRDGEVEEGIDFLQKPYYIETLSKKLREVLDRDRQSLQP